MRTIELQGNSYRVVKTTKPSSAKNGKSSNENRSYLYIRAYLTDSQWSTFDKLLVRVEAYECYSDGEPVVKEVRPTFLFFKKHESRNHEMRVPMTVRRDTKMSSANEIAIEYVPFSKYLAVRITPVDPSVSFRLRTSHKGKPPVERGDAFVYCLDYNKYSDLKQIPILDSKTGRQWNSFEALQHGIVSQSPVAGDAHSDSDASSNSSGSAPRSLSDDERRSPAVTPTAPPTLAPRSIASPSIPVVQPTSLEALGVVLREKKRLRDELARDAAVDLLAGRPYVGPLRPPLRIDDVRSVMGDSVTSVQLLPDGRLQIVP